MTVPPRKNLICLVELYLVSLIVSQQITASPGLIGQKGEPGLPGFQGPPGPIGAKGEAGLPGPKGESGNKGVPGLPGNPGPDGVKGAIGPAGETGLPGALGSVGAVGPSGPKGDMGVIGSTGATGPTGAEGPQGEKGVIGGLGEVGSIGAKGDKGATGRAGSQGPSGDQGEKGEKGVIGRTFLEMDTNECVTGVVTCEEITAECKNLALGYMCECLQGYKPDENNNTTCIDIDECSNNNGGCTVRCINTIGGYYCECPSGTKSSTLNSRICEDINECVGDECGAGEYCVNHFGGYSCVSADKNDQETTIAQTAVADALTAALVDSMSFWILIIWLAVITLFTIIILVWIILILYRVRKAQNDLKRDNRTFNTMAYNNDAMSDTQSMPGTAGHGEQLREQGTMDIDIPRLPPTIRGKPSSVKMRAYNKKEGSSIGRSARPPSASSQDGDRTASVRSTRAASGERAATNRLSDVDTCY